MPSRWSRLPHRGVVQRRADESDPSPSFDHPVPTLAPPTIPISRFNAPVNGSSTSSQSPPSSATDPQQSSSIPATETSSPLTSGTTIPPVQSSSARSSASSISGPDAGSSSSQHFTSSSASAQAIASSSSNLSSSTLHTSSSVHLSQNFFKSSSAPPSTPTIVHTVPTPTDTDVVITPSVINPTALPSPSGVSGTLQAGANPNDTSSGSVSHKNVIIGVASAIGGLAVLCAVLLVLFRLVSRYRKAKAEKARRELWRYSVDSWIGTRMGESRAPTPAAANILGTYRSTDGHPLGLGAPPTSEMQQTQTAMVADYLGRFMEPAVQLPAPSHSPDRDSIGLHSAATPPGSTTALVFSGADSELAYADHSYSSPAMPDIPVIRVTDPGAEHSRPPTNFSDLDYDVPRHSPYDVQAKLASSSSTTRSRSNSSAKKIENPFIHPSERLAPAQAPSTLQVNTLQPENPFRSHRESAKSIKSPSGYFRMSDPFGATVQRAGPGSSVPVVSPAAAENSVISMEGYVVDPSSTSRSVRPSRK